MPLLRWVARHDGPARLLNRALAPFNPLDPRRYADPYPLYDELRAHGPVFRHPRTGIWMISGYAEVEQALRAPTSVNRDHVMRNISPYNRLRSDMFELASSMLLMIDPPDHTRIRKLVSRAFTPRSVAQLEPEVERVAKELLEQVPTDRPFDAVAAFASPLPIYMIGELLGLPRSTWPRLKACSDIIAFVVDPIVGFDPRSMEAAADEVIGIFRATLAQRRNDPRDDLLTRLVQAEADGDRLNDRELMSLLMLLMVAGHETTTGLIGTALVALDRHRDQRRALAANLGDDAAIELAVEEFLRFDSPVQATDRITTEPITVGDHEIPAGAMMGLFIGAANRDPRRYARPNRLEVDRPDPRPMSFGHGIHHCVGAALARLEAKVALRTFLQRFPDYSIDESGLGWKRSITLRGPQVLPIEP